MAANEGQKMDMYLRLENDEEVRCYPPFELFEADKSKDITLAFDNHEMYHGFISDIDDNIHIPTKSGIGVSLPFNRLVAWFYTEDSHVMWLF